MYSSLPYFVYGFHGCDERTKEAVLHGKKELIVSKNNYDWLGSGIYFWEQNAARAMEFAQLSRDNPSKRYTSRPIEHPAVLGAVIDLGNCLNLMDSRCTPDLRRAHDFYSAYCRHVNIEPRKNKGPLRELDNMVLETLHFLNRTEQRPEYDTVRGLFIEGDQSYPGAGFYEHTHIQLCVRNIDCIKAFFHPRDKSDDPFQYVCV